MQTVANLETVSRACNQLEAEGQKITGRAVLAITGGSLGTVLSLIKEWRQGAIAAPVAQPEIPAELQAVLTRCLGLAQDKAAEVLKAQINDATTRETEALEGLAEAEELIATLTASVAEIRQQTIEKDQTADKAAAVAAEKIESMTERIQALETERRQLIEAAEASRTEAAKAFMQVERADLATVKAEDRLQALEVQIVECTTVKIEAEKVAAVAKQRSTDMAEQLKDVRATLAETKSDMATSLKETRATLAEAQKEGKALSAQLMKDISDLREANKVLEIKNAGLIASMEAAKKTDIK